MKTFLLSLPRLLFHKKGILIVIDGTDSSGKATQVKFLTDRLINSGYVVKTVDFPEYHKNFFGRLIYKFLHEEKYNWLGTHPEIASNSYAADRWESKKKMDLWLKKGYVVIANRYVSANQIHQGGKIKDLAERIEYLRILDEMEYRVFGIPRPNVVFFLNVPVAFEKKLLGERAKTTETGTGKKLDVHEKNEEFIENSYKTAIWLSENQPEWQKIDCVENDQLRTRESIHNEIYEKVKILIKNRR